MKGVSILSAAMENGCIWNSKPFQPPFIHPRLRSIAFLEPSDLDLGEGQLYWFLFGGESLEKDVGEVYYCEAQDFP